MVETIVAFAGLALLIGVAIAVAWQARRRVADRSIVYSVEDSIEFVYSGLDERSAAVLKRSDLRRLLEWSVRYFQVDAKPVASSEPPVVGGLEAAEYVQDQTMAIGFAYDADVIVEVLRLQSEYLFTLGAFGAEVRSDAPEQGRLGGDASGLA